MLKDLPEIMKPLVEMNNPNENICFHEGTFFLTWKGLELKITGKIIFKWLPKLSAYFQAKLDENFTQTIFKPFETDLAIEIRLSNPKFNAKGIISKVKNNGKDYDIFCHLVFPIVFGENELSADHIRFEIPNLRNFRGIAVKDERSGLKNRIIFENKESKITIDKVVDYLELKQKLVDTGGHQILYTGKLESNSSRQITNEKSSYILDSFSYFLHFINGRRVSPIFCFGFVDSIEKWKFISPHFNDQYKFVHSWPSDNTEKGLSEIWNNFSELWENESDRECLKTILHWYVEANSNTAFLEGSIVLIQNALELLFHWLIAEKMNYVNSTDADKLSASAKIGFLLSFNKINPSIPDEFEGLIKLAKQYTITSGPDSFITIRNCIVHPSQKKRKTLKEIENNAKYEALNLGIWYVEIILLKLLKFKGEYKNRCKSIKNLDDYDVIE